MAERKTAMRLAFERAKVGRDTVGTPLVNKCLRVMERGAGIRQPRRRPRK